MRVERLLMLLLLAAAFCFGMEYRVETLMSPESKKTVAQKLETAPVAYYGTLMSRHLYSEETLLSEGFDKTNPKVYAAFVEWKNRKENRIQSTLDSLPKIYRMTYDYENRHVRNLESAPLFVLMQEDIDVDLFYDKSKKSWVKPDSGNTKKSIFSMVYVGVDVDCDSSQCGLRERVWLLPHEEVVLDSLYREFDNDLLKSEIEIRRIFFLDGFTHPLETIQEDALVYPNRMIQKLKLNYAIENRKRMIEAVAYGNFDAALALADSADLDYRSRILLHVLLNDYEFIQNEDSVKWYLGGYDDYGDGLNQLLDFKVEEVYRNGSYCKALSQVPNVDSASVCETVRKIALQEYHPTKRVERDVYNAAYKFFVAFDVGRPFLAGDFPDFNPVLYLDFGIGLYFENFVLGLESAIRMFDAKCDSCGTGGFGAQGMFGYKWLKTRHLEGVGFVNLGFSALETPPYPKSDPDAKYDHERFFCYGAGAYIDAFFLDFNDRGIGSVLGLRLRGGFNNMNVSRIGHASGISPYVSLGVTWHVNFTSSSTSGKRSTLLYYDGL